MHVSTNLRLANELTSSHPMIPTFIPSTPAPSQILSTSIPLLTSLSPLLIHRITTPTPPPFFPTSLSNYLLNLSDTDLNTCHTLGLQTYLRTHAPPPLSTLATSVHNLSQHFPPLPVTSTSPHLPTGRSKRRSKSRPRTAKRAQILALTALVNEVLSQSSVPIARIVDLGAGHAHLSAHLASHFHSSAIPVHAVERDARMAQTAEALHGGSLGMLTVQRAMVGVEDVYVGSADFLVGLHACGSLGDALVRLAVRRRVAAVILVSCCLQKIEEEVRQPVSDIVKETRELREVLAVGKRVLGVTNGARGIRNEGDLRARETRHALRVLLEERGRGVKRIGDEVEGISRHRLRRGLAEVVHEVLGRRGLEGISEEEIEKRLVRAREEYAVMRRLSLPRLLAGEALEMALVLDRAAKLEEAGFRHVATCRIWGDDVSVRNLCCVAWR